ncbi:hypothetical protein MANES_05G129701v8 [Manihot esculenta]|uniref:Uncharacterized protein n=1 Tax=Manihot esculenta TaxID=3983 RepID=A0ACB7HP18_MANES|nr:hypothetical protein MANES_05G129701v8 [Manihot esculenta]
MVSSSTTNIAHASGRFLISINDTHIFWVLSKFLMSVTQQRKQVANLDYEYWECQDQLFFTALRSSLSFYVMNVVADAETFVEALKKLQITYANKLATRILSLLEGLSLCGSPVSNVDLVVRVLEGVGHEFCDIVATIHPRDTVISFDEL